LGVGVVLVVADVVGRASYEYPVKSSNEEGGVEVVAAAGTDGSAEGVVNLEAKFLPPIFMAARLAAFSSSVSSVVPEEAP
jgi:hypothetical protein